MSLSVAVAGASGYAGGELLRLLSAHPELEVRTVTAHSNAGSPLIALQPHLRSLAHLELQPTEPEVLDGHDVVFLALPHGKSGEVTEHLDAATLVVDCGADHRLTSEADWTAYYGGDYYGAWDYGLPELVLADGGRQRERLAGSRRIAVPGCNVTAITLALAPAVHAGVVLADDLVAMLAVGPSGAGRTLRNDLLASELLGSANAYAVGGRHRHNPEIRQNLEAAGAAQDVAISFTPVLVPMARGILATSTARLADGATAADLDEGYAVYEQERFVHVLAAGEFPRVADTTGSNTCLIGLAVDERAGRAVAVSALDNLGKGTAGAAIQSANIALGLPEAMGLPVDGVAP